MRSFVRKRTPNGAVEKDSDRTVAGHEGKVEHEGEHERACDHGTERIEGAAQPCPKVHAINVRQHTRQLPTIHWRAPDAQEDDRDAGEKANDDQVVAEDANAALRRLAAYRERVCGIGPFTNRCEKVEFHARRTPALTAAVRWNAWKVSMILSGDGRALWSSTIGTSSSWICRGI